MKHYQVVAAVVEVDGKVLCMQKGHTPFAYTTHRWEFPGGKIETGETPQQALRRELQEELELDVTVREHLATVTHVYPDFAITMQTYRCSATSRTITLREHRAYAWIEPQNLMSLDWCEADIPIARLVNDLNDQSRLSHCKAGML